MSQLQPVEHPRTKREQTEATRRKLVETARQLFTQHGYAATATEVIVAQADVTRGALYHHFGSKEGLFHAVIYEVLRDAAMQIETATKGITDAWEQFIVGCHKLLEISLEPAMRQIVLIDAPAVVGDELWKDTQADPTARLLHETMEELIACGVMKPLPIDALMALVGGALKIGALWIATAADPQVALRDCIITFDAMASGLRNPSMEDARRPKM